uniref:Uncharacterized protein n=1 Tax=Arundo donax TaxID=35708 RepID=A0A0A9ATX8_ARUDO
MRWRTWDVRRRLTTREKIPAEGSPACRLPCAGR